MIICAEVFQYLFGPVAQLGERTVRIRKVVGSNPFRSTILIAGRTPECEIIVLRYGFWLALDLTVQA